MLGTTGGRIIGPSGSQTHRNLWPPPTAGRALEFQTNGEVTDSLFGAGGFNTPPANPPFLSSVSPLELVSKNYHSGTVSFSQANSIFVQSHTDFLGGTSVSTKKTETCFGRWEHGLEPLHIQVPPPPPLPCYIPAEQANTIICAPSTKCDIIKNSKTKSNGYPPISYTSTKLNKNYCFVNNNNNNNKIIVTNSNIANTSTTTTTASRGNLLSGHRNSSSASANKHFHNDVDVNNVVSLNSSGCSRTIPILWTPSSSTASSTTLSSANTTKYQQQQHQTKTKTTITTTSSTTNKNKIVDSSSRTIAGCSLLQIKREPCQVSEITTSNNLGHTLTTVVKIEPPSPKQRTMDNVQNSAQSAGAIPVGIAVARQRLQEHAQHQQQPKDLNRFGIGIATDLGGASTSAAFSQNMFFAGTNSTMIPSFTSTAAAADAVTMGVPNVQNAVRTPPTLWQYPTQLPMESMLPMPMPPVGFQLVRDPSTGQFLFLPTATSIDKLYISYPEPFQQAVVWPSYQQQAALQAPHLLMPSMAQQMQPPPLTPLQLLGSDYLSGTTLHQHTQTHSTRLVALTDNKRKQSIPNIPLPMQPTTLIKIEDCSNNMPSNCVPTSHHQSSIYEPCKSTAMQTATITTAVQTNDMSPADLSTHQLYYQTEGNLIQIAAAAQQHATQNSNELMETVMDCRPNIVPIASPLSDNRCLSPQPDGIMDTEQLEHTVGPEVQDANIQTDTPVMSEDDNTNSAEDCTFPASTMDENNVAIPTSTSFQDLCHNITSISEIPSESSSFSQTTTSDDINCSTRTQSTELSFDSSSTTVTSSNMIEEQMVSQQLISPPATTPIMSVTTEPPSILAVIVTPQPTIEYEQPIPTEMTAIIEPQSQQRDSICAQESVHIPEPEPEPHTVTVVPDISGLELLSNSIEAFEKKTHIKQEPIDRPELCYPDVPQPQQEPVQHQVQSQQHQSQTQSSQEEPIDCSLQQAKQFIDTVSPVANNGTSHLGGLNLLCALAEQRFQEEVGQRSRKRSSSSEGSDSKKMKKHHKDKKHHKEKKSKHGARDRKERRSKHQQQSDDDEVIIDRDLKETFDRVRASYPKCECKNSTSSGGGGCCREKCQWPTPEEVYSAMKTDLRHRLTKMAKEVQAEKRRLDEIKSIDKTTHSDRELTPATSSISSPNCSTTSSQSDGLVIETQKSHSDNESVYRFEDNDTNSSSAVFKRKVGSSSVAEDVTVTKDEDDKHEAAKKTKSLVGYIFASKKRINDAKNDNSLSTITDEASVASDCSPQLLVTSIKHEYVDDDDAARTDLFGSQEKKHHKSKHPSKHKKSKDKERKHRRSSEVKERKRRIDTQCTLTGDYLDNLATISKPRVLTAMGGLFYAGRLSAIEPPDVYAVTLDGERGNRPHIMSREEILRDAILEVAPHSVDEILPGARICAYWSQQYRCLYPGTVAQPGSNDYEPNPKFLIVEFDDGDSGRIAIEDIRFLLSDYPIVEYDPNPLLTLGKRKQRISQSMGDDSLGNDNLATTSTNCFSIAPEVKSKDDDKKANRERRRLKKLRKDKLKQLVTGGSDSNNVDLDKKHKHKHKCSDEFCKHRKHKKRRKHKKHSHRDSSGTPTTELSVNGGNTEAIAVVDDDEDDDDADTERTDNSDNAQNGFPMPTEEKLTLAPNTFVAELKEETLTEDDVASSITEDSSGSSYQPGTKKDKSADNHSKIAAFLPARQLWAWSGKGKRSGAKGRGKKQFFRAIQRGKETISVGDSAVFLSTGRPDRPYIGKIESLWETSLNNRVVRVKWYYHPEETTGCPKLLYPGALFQSPHADENDVQTISHKCKVLPLNEYTNKYGPDPKNYVSVYDNNDTFYLAGYYDPTAINLKFESNIPTIPGIAGDDEKKSDE